MKFSLILLIIAFVTMFIFIVLRTPTSYLDYHANARIERDADIASKKESHSKNLPEEYLLDGFDGNVVYSKIIEKDQYTYTMISYSPLRSWGKVIREESFNKLEIDIRKRVSETRFQNTSQIIDFLSIF